ncbi:MAG TPA: hypothetical protein P5267_01570 [Patescibacteria group bacterium]|nr:hypothetical protein [Patescibacteria group bacterium]
MEINSDEAEADNPVGFSGLKSMNVCRGNSELCYTRDVEFVDGEVERIILPEGETLEIDFSDCEGEYCYAEDENGTEWDLVE